MNLMESVRHELEYFYANNFKEVEGAYWFGSVRAVSAVSQAKKKKVLVSGNPTDPPETAPTVTFFRPVCYHKNSVTYNFRYTPPIPAFRRIPAFSANYRPLVL